MNKQFLIFLAVGLAVVGAGVSFLLIGTKGNHLELNGTILKVRTLPLSEVASLAVVDFRVIDPSDVPFVIKSATLTLETSTGTILDGMAVSKPDVENVFKYNPILGPKFNDVLGIEDRVQAHQHVDRMVAARFEISDAQADDRKAIHLHIEEMDGVTADFVEKK